MHITQIANFPEFSKLHISHKKPYTAITKNFAPYSDFNFTSLFSWSMGIAEVSLLHDNLVIKLPDYLDGHPVYSLLGKHKIDASLEALLDITDKLELVPEVIIENIKKKSAYRISENRDNHDYIYELKELSELAGAKYKKIRNKSHQFRKAHEDRRLNIRVINSIDRHMVRVIEHVNQQWAEGTGREPKDLQEKEAIENLLNHSPEFDLILTLIEVDDEVKAFSINEVLDGEYAICHFEKALRNHHETIYTFLTCEVAQQLTLMGCRRVNWEQDLGIEGLRKSKLAYHPSEMLKKFTIQRSS